MSSLAILRLVRVSSSATAPSDVLAGHALALVVTPGAVARPTVGAVVAVAAASMLLYWAGLALNDLLDRHEDARHARGRPIPSGDVSPSVAAGITGIAMVTAVALAFTAGPATGVGALVVVAAIVVYDAVAKRNAVAAATAMGACRAANLALGALLVSEDALSSLAPWISVYGAYIAALTIVGKSETADRATRALHVASWFGTRLPVVALGTWVVMQRTDVVLMLISAIPMLALIWMLESRRQRFRAPDFSARDAGLWVRDGVLGITLYNGAFLIAAGQPWLGGIVALLFPVSLRVSRFFSPS